MVFSTVRRLPHGQRGDRLAGRVRRPGRGSGGGRHPDKDVHSPRGHTRAGHDHRGPDERAAERTFGDLGTHVKDAQVVVAKAQGLAENPRP